jgi:hypothetical protein
MKRLSCIKLLVWLAVALIGFAPSIVWAQVELRPERTSYRFLPRYSVLHESGGIYPREVDFRVIGTFDLVTEPGPTDVWPPVYVAKFDDVEAWASHPILAYVLPLNQVLNLEGLHGYQLPVEAPFDLFKFEGTTQDGSAVDLYASIQGPWLRLRGGTTPPPGSADMFEYTIRALARETPFADFNGTGDVDWSDLAKWRSGFSATTPSVEPERFGDADGDRLVDGTDFLSWQQQVGVVDAPLAELDAAMDAALASLNLTFAAVPEPSAASIFAVGMLTLLNRRRNHLRV